MSKPSDLVQGTLDLLLLKIPDWRMTENNRRAKFYELTKLGRRQLQREAANWERLSGAISHVMRLKEV